SADFMANPLTDFPATSDGSLSFSQTYTLTNDMLAALNPINRRAIVLKGITENGTYNPMLPVAAGLIQSSGGGPPSGIPLPPAAPGPVVGVRGAVARRAHWPSWPVLSALVVLRSGPSPPGWPPRSSSSTRQWRSAPSSPPFEYSLILPVGSSRCANVVLRCL